MSDIEKQVQGRTYTSNASKLLKHLDKLKLIQDGKRPSPVMFHMSPCNPCNLTCSFCCFANRTMKEMLTMEQMKKAIDSFAELGTKGMEFSVSADEIVPYFIRNELRVDTIDNIVKNKIGSSFSINDNGQHINENIKHFIKHKQTEPLYRIGLQTGRNIKVTKSHSIFFYENNKIIYKPVSEAQIGDLVVVSTKQIRGEDNKIDHNYARLLGFFVAEGSFSFQREKVPHGIHFTLDKYENEHKYIDDINNILKDLGYKTTKLLHKNQNKTSISVCSKELCEDFLLLQTGKKARNKRVPNIIFNADINSQMNFLMGLFAGDGCFRHSVDSRGYRRNSLHLKTASQLLQKTVGFLLQQLGISCSFSEHISPERKIESRSLKPSNYFTVDIYGKDNLIKMNSIIEYMGCKLCYKDSIYSFPGSRFKPIKISDDAIALPINDIKEVEPEDYVYDLSVGSTHRFISSFGILCHNTGGGEPTLHPQFGEAVNYAHSKGFKIGVCTNGTTITKWDKVGNVWDKLSWVRLGMYGFTEGYTYDLDALRKYPNLTISAAYVWDEAIDTSLNPNITGKWIDNKSKKLAKNIQTTEQFYAMLEWVEKEKIPTRIAFNAIKKPEEVMKDIETIRKLIADKKLKYAFLSDFNYKGVRLNDHCYMHNVKPCVFTDGQVYVCPSAELAIENAYQVNSELRLCDIDGILDYYNSITATNGRRRNHGCSFCKYALQNELIDDIVRETEHNDFA